MKNRVLIDGRVLIPRRKSGVGHYVSNLLKALDHILSDPSIKTGYDVRLLVPYRAKKMIRREMEFSNIGFRSIPLPFRGINFLSRYGLLPWLDIFYGKGLYIFPTFTKERLLRSRSIVFFYDLAFEKYPDSIHPKQLSLIQKKLADSLSADGVLTISEAIAKELTEKISPNTKVVVASPAVDTRTFYKRSIDEIVSVKNRLKLSGAYILAVGNLEPRKNISTLVTAYKILPKKIRERYALVIIGAEAWNSTTTKELIKESVRNGYNIRLLIGKINDSDLPVLYSGASLFVMPSVYEGYGIPIVEAMACNTPVISGKDGAIAEAGGGASIVVKDIENAQELSNTIADTITSESTITKCQQKGLMRIEGIQDWRVPARVLYKLIGDVAMERK